jgi:hypothetical protein
MSTESRVLDELALIDPRAAVLRDHSVSSIITLMDDTYPRITGFVRLNDSKLLEVLQTAKFKRNRAIDTSHLEYLQHEARSGRLLPTNILAFAQDEDGALHKVNGNHTGEALKSEDISLNSAFQWVIWLNTSKVSEYPSRVYNACDAGKNRTRKNRLDAASYDTTLGLLKGDAAWLDRSMNIILGDGCNSPRGEKLLISKSSVERIALMESFLPSFQKYLDAADNIPQKTPTGIHLQATKMLKNAAITAAFLVAHKNDPSDDMVEFFKNLATGNIGAKTPESALWNFFHHNPAYDKVSGGSRFEPLYVATLRALTAHAMRDNKLTVTVLNKHIGGENTQLKKDNCCVVFGKYTKRFKMFKVAT